MDLSLKSLSLETPPKSDIPRETRDKVLGLIAKKLSAKTDILNEYDVHGNTLKSIVEDLEQGLYNHSHSITDYKSKYRTLTANVSYTPNHKFVLGRLFTGEWKAVDIAGMTNEELYPELLEKMKEEKENEERIKADFKQFKLDHTGGGLLTCGKCKSGKVSFVQIQTRSADESMTLKCTCEDCGKRWSMN